MRRAKGAVRAWRLRLAWLAPLLAACGHHDTGPAPSPSALAVDAQASLVAFGDAALAEVDAAAPSYPWADAVRLERWEDAWRGLDVLPDADKQKPEVRYARGRVAIARKDPKAAIALLDGLEKDIPLLEGDIARRRAEARYDAGDYLEAAEYFVARGSPSGWLRASDAFEKGKEIARARAACDKVLASDKRTRAQEAEARARRLRIAPERPPEDAIADVRWLAIEAPDLPAGKDADAKLAALDPSHPLTAEERMKRARSLGDAQMVDDALREIDRAASAPGRGVPAIERRRARADALFRARGRFLEAARAYDECAAAGGSRAQEDAFHAARSLSRADRDDEAIERYARVARRSPRTTWAEQATFLAARLQLLHGRWSKAAAAFDAYARDFPSGADHREAARDRALAHLVAKDYKGARRLFEQLADDPSDALESARAGTMAALAALRDGDATHAIARWTDVARSRPLSWPALVARSRLAEAHAPLPPAIDADPPAAPPSPIAVTLPPPVDLLHRVGLDADAEVFLREREALITGGAGARGVEALCAAYGQLGRAKRRYQIAQQAPGALLATAPSARNRWVWDCVYPAPYAEQVRAEEAASHLPAGLVYAVMRQESGFDPEVVSSARAVGLMQLLPETAKTLAAGRSIPHDEAWLTKPPHNIAIGARYLKDLVDELHGQVPLALAAYNAGPEAVLRWSSRMKSIDLDVFVELIPFAETRVYVARVVGNWARYTFAADPSAGPPTIALTLEP